jgi:hypothetical protein
LACALTLKNEALRPSWITAGLSGKRPALISINPWIRDCTVSMKQRSPGAYHRANVFPWQVSATVDLNRPLWICQAMLLIKKPIHGPEKAEAPENDLKPGGFLVIRIREVQAGRVNS